MATLLRARRAVLPLVTAAFVVGSAPAAELIAQERSRSTARPSFDEDDEIVIPAGTVLALALDSRVSSEHSGLEDRVRAHLRRPLTIDGRVVLPAGTPVTGVVTEARRPGRVKGLGRIGFRFTSLVVDGERHPLRTSQVVRQAKPTKKRDAATIAVPAGAGAVVGGVLDGKKGAVKGAAVGGAGGTAVVLATRGREIEIGPGAPVGVRLLQPLIVRTARW